MHHWILSLVLLHLLFFCQTFSMLGEAREGLWEHSTGRWLAPFALTQMLFGLSSFHQHHCPMLQQELCVAKLPLSPFQSTASRRGQRWPGCSLSSPGQTPRSGSAWPDTCELPGAAPRHQLSQNCPGAVLTPGVPNGSCLWAVPCSPSAYSSAPMGFADPASASGAAASPHSTANAATLMQSKELAAPGRNRESLSLLWMPSGKPSWGHGWRVFCPLVCRDLTIAISSLLQGAGISRKGIPGWEKGCSVLQVQPWLMGSREERGHSPFSAPDWSNKGLFSSYMLFLTVIWREKSLKRNIQSLSGRALDRWENTTVIFIHTKSLGNMISLF